MQRTIERAQPVLGEAKPVPENVDRAIARARDFLLDRQKPEGYWVGFLENDSSSTGLYILLTHYLERVDPERNRKAVRTLVRTRNEEGGWVQVPGGPTHLDTTLINYLALALEEVPEEDPWMERSRGVIEKLGGRGKVHFLSKIVLGFFGIYPFDHLPWITARLIENPGFIYRQGFARTILIPYMALYERKAVRDFSCRIPLATNTWKGAGEGAVAEAFRLVAGGFSLFQDPVLSSPHTEKCLEWIAERQEADGTWGGVFHVTFFSLLALHSGREQRWQTLIRKGLEGVHSYQQETREEIVQQFSVSPVMDTAYAVRALCQAGVPTDSAEVQRAVGWLTEKQSRIRGDWKHNNPEGKPGGWSFEFHNTRYPDLDCTSMVLNALTYLSEESLRPHLSTVDRGLEWVVSMQNWDGGFAVWDKNNWLRFKVLSGLLDVGDYSHVDITARVVICTSRLLRLPRYRDRVDLRRAIRLAVRFLWSRQERFSHWYGRWGVNYTYATGQVLEALGSHGVRASHLLVRPALRWMEKNQNPDGGWGESVESYEMRRFVPAPSSAAQTSMALLGLLGIGTPRREPVERGVLSLLNTQKPGGDWADRAFFATNIPKVWYGRYELLPTLLSLLALCNYRRTC
jgi:squalene-hopene/tetraprenyl-beta-curcumene cyclase